MEMERLKIWHRGMRNSKFEHPGGNTVRTEAVLEGRFKMRERMSLGGGRSVWRKGRERRDRSIKAR